MRKYGARDFNERTIKALPGGAVVALVGENEVLKREFFAKALKIFGLEPSDPFAVQRLSAQDLSADPGRLADEAAAISMMGELRLIEAVCSQSMAATLLPVACDVIADKTILFLSFEEWLLDAWSGENAPDKIFVVDCPAENARSMNEAINEKIAALGLRLDPLAHETLVGLLADQREAIALELDKLAILSANAPDHSFSAAEIVAIIADASRANAESAAEHILKGDIANLLLILEQETSAAAHAAILRNLARLLSNAFRTHVNNWRSGSGGALARLGEKDFVRLLRFTNQAAFQSRALTHEGDLFAQQALLQIARFMAGRGAR